MAIRRFVRLRKGLLRGAWTHEAANELKTAGSGNLCSPEAGLLYRSSLWQGCYALDSMEDIASRARIKPPPSWNLKWLIPLLIRTGHEDTAAVLYERANPLVKGLFRANPSVLQLCYRRDLAVYKPAYSCAFLETLFSLTLTLSEFLADKRGQSICIVGNAPSGDRLNASRGSQIDQHDLVFRFNDFSSDPASCGKRTDLWITTPSRDSYSKSGLSDQTPMMLTGNDLLYRPGGIAARLSEAVRTEKAIILTDTDDWSSLVRQLKAPPSAGLLVAKTTRRHHSGATSFFGFSGGKSEQNHSYDNRGFSRRHNWQEEAALYAELMPNRHS